MRTSKIFEMNIENNYFNSLPDYENWDNHHSAISSFFPNDKQVSKALNIVKGYHNQPRHHYDGNYMNRPARVARILLEEFNINDQTTILTALCHDLGEWSEYDTKQIVHEFGEQVDQGVSILTWDQKGEWSDFVDQIVNSGNENLIKIKIADKLDNNRAALMTDNIDEMAKARKKTLEIMQPIIKKYYPEAWPKFEEVLDKIGYKKRETSLYNT